MPADALAPPNFLSQRVRQARYYYLNLTPSNRAGLEIVCGGVEQCRPDYEMRRDSFRYCSIEFVAAGRGQLVLDGRHHALGPGVAFSYGPGVPHRITTDPHAPMTKYFVDFTGREAASLIGRCKPLSRGTIQVSDPLSVADVYENIHRSAQAGNLQSREICLLLLRLLVLRLGELGIDRPHVNERAMRRIASPASPSSTQNPNFDHTGRMPASRNTRIPIGTETPCSRAIASSAASSSK